MLVIISFQKFLGEFASNFVTFLNYFTLIEKSEKKNIQICILITSILIEELEEKY